MVYLQMQSNDLTQMRDAIVKLETKMEVMSDSMVSLANSVEKLADIRFEIVGIKKDVAALHSIAEKRELEIKECKDDLDGRLRELEKVQDKNSYVVNKIEVFWTAIITGGAAFVWWLLKGN